MNLRVLVAAAIATSVLAVIPATAGATDYCVGSVPLCAGVSEPAGAAGFQAAFTASNTNVGHDRIFLAAGTYDFGTGSTFAPSSGEVLDIVGSGSASTKFTCAMTGIGACFAFAAPPTATMSTLSGVAVEPTGTASNVTALSMQRVLASDIAIKDPGGMSAFKGIVPIYGSVVDGCTVALSSSNAIGVQANNSPLTIKHCTVSGGTNSTGVSVGGMINTYTVEHCKFKDVRSGIFATEGDVVVSDTLFDQGTLNGIAITIDYSGTGTVPASLVANRITVAGTGANQRGFWLGADSPSESIVAEITDSVISSSGTGFQSMNLFHSTPSGATTVNLTRTAWNPALVVSGGTAPITPTSTGTIDLATIAPGFVNPGMRDYHLDAASPLVDVGSATVTAGATDLDGAARLVDGNGDGVAKVDLGAYEFQPPAPGGSPAVIPVAKIVAKPKRAFRRGTKGGFGKAKKGAASFSVRFTNSAKAKFTLKSITRKKKLKSVKGSQTLKVADGTIKLGFRGRWNKKKLKAGKYRVTITPLASDGTAGKPVTVHFTLK